MTPAQIRQQIRTIKLQTTALAVSAELALTPLELKLRIADGYPTIASGADVGSGSSGDRTVSVEEPCTGQVRCSKLDCPNVNSRHTHPCKIKGEHTHTERVAVTSVEAAVLNRIGDRDDQAIGAQAVLDEWFDYLNAAVLGMKHSLRIANTHAAGHAHTDRHRQRCKGTSDAEGSTCEQWASPRPDISGNGQTIDDGRCLDCGLHVDRKLEERRKVRLQADLNRRQRKHAS